MKNALIVVLSTNLVMMSAQDRFISDDYSSYFEWFHQHSQVEALYSDASILHAFSQNTEVFSDPCNTSEILTILPIGQSVKNIAYPDYFLPEDEINGYGDIWYHVEVQEQNGTTIKGYIWGADIAKGWREAEITGNGNPELVMLGVSSIPRIKPEDIYAEIRIVKDQQLYFQKNLPGLCIFEDCASSPLLRTFASQSLNGQIVIEASTITIGCDAGIERAFFYWNGKGLQRVFHAELTTNKLYTKKSFHVMTSPAEETYQICQYSHQDENFNPVWKCESVRKDNHPTPPKQITKSKKKKVAKA